MLHIVMEWAEAGKNKTKNLHRFLPTHVTPCAGTLGDAIKRQRGQRFSDSYIWKALLHVLLALHHVHSRKVPQSKAKAATARGCICTTHDCAFATPAHSPTAHQVLHRDIKSQNIFIAANGSIKIGDLGVAKLLGTRMQVLSPTSKFTTPFVC